MIVLTKEVTDKDRSLKTQLTISCKSSEDKISGDRVWTKEGFFMETKPELNLEKKYIPENALFHINQSYTSTVKNGNLTMYHHNFIIGQLIVAANQPIEIDEYVCKDNEVILFRGEMKESYFYHTVLILIKRLFCILLRNKKYLTLLFLHPLRNITARL